jgi:hypothetical protein
MLFNYYDSSYGLTRKNEWIIWRDVSLLAWCGSHPYGLACASLKRGFKVTLIREKRAFWKDPKCPKNNEPLHYSIAEQGKKAKKLGVIEKIKRNIDLPFLKEIAKDGVYPIVLMRFIRKNGTIGALHWVIIIEVEKNYVIINDPYYKGNRKIPIKLFMKGWDGARLPKWGSAKEVLIIEK